MARRNSSGDERAGARTGRPCTVADLLPDVGGRAFRRFGFAQGQLLGRWRDIVGPLYARWSVPQQLKPQRGQPGAVLTILVEGPFATQLQHASGLIADRCNRILGDGAVARIRLVQGAVPRQADGCEADMADRAPVAPEGLRAITDPSLRSALEDLAAAVARTVGPPRIR